MKDGKEKRGWAWPDNSRKAHFFINGDALCGKWLFFGDVDGSNIESVSVDDCAKCRKKLTELLEKEKAC